MNGEREFTGDHGTGGRPKFGAGPAPVEKSCVDCKQTEKTISGGVEEGILRNWPEGPLRKYGDDFACYDCSNGAYEGGRTVDL